MIWSRHRLNSGVIVDMYILSCVSSDSSCFIGDSVHCAISFLALGRTVIWSDDSLNITREIVRIGIDPCTCVDSEYSFIPDYGRFTIPFLAHGRTVIRSPDRLNNTRAILSNGMDPYTCVDSDYFISDYRRFDILLVAGGRTLIWSCHRWEDGDLVSSRSISGISILA